MIRDARKVFDAPLGPPPLFLMSLQIPDHPFKAFIFDCDGTLVDSMPLHYIAWCEALKTHGAEFEFTEEFFYGHAGVKEQDVVRILNDMARRAQTAIIVVTHDEKIIPTFKRIYHIRDGQTVEEQGEGRSLD